MGRPKGSVPLDQIRHGYRKPDHIKVYWDEKTDESWWFYPKHKAEK